jgi:hypothetical protein
MQEQESNLFNGVVIDAQAKSSLVGLASWAMIVVVTSVIGYVLSIVGLFTSNAPAAVQSEGFDSYLKLTGDNSIGVVIPIVIGLLLNFFLYRFATLAKSGVNTHNQDQLTASFKNLKIYFAIATILLLIVMLIVFIAFAMTL